MASVPDPKYGDKMPERGARLARREERAYREYVSDEQRRQAGAAAARFVRGGVETGCPARQMAAYFGFRTLAAARHRRSHAEAAENPELAEIIFKKNTL